MRRISSLTLSFSLSLLMGLAITLTIFSLPKFLHIIDGGPLDSHPRLQASVESPDRTLIVKVFRQRPSSMMPGAAVVVKVYDREGGVVYERVIRKDSTWTELVASFAVYFEADRIYIFGGHCPAGCHVPTHVIEAAELRARQLPHPTQSNKALQLTARQNVSQVMFLSA